MIQTLAGTRYFTPLREGGSLPAVVEAADGQLYVMKFAGAGQGPKALIAELIAGEIARSLGLRVPELVFLTLDATLARSEPHQEIQDLLLASAGRSAIVWFDAYVTNVDRTPRNVNLLIWRESLWLIDHGAALYFHHGWDNYLARSQSPFPLIKDHTLIAFASALPEADIVLRPLLTEPLIRSIVELVPEEWLEGGTAFSSPAEHRPAYATYLLKRLESSAFLEEAIRVHEHV